MIRLFTDHPASVDESYFEHMAAAGSFAGRLFVAAFACLIHAIFPFLFVTTGSRMISEMHDRMVTNRAGAKNPRAARLAAGGD